MGVFLDRIKKAFFGRDPTLNGAQGSVRYYSPYRTVLGVSNLRSVVSSVYNRIAVDVSKIDFRHVRLNDDMKFKEEIDSSLNDCLKINPNIDQSRQAFFVDLIMSMIDEGCVALVPYDTDVDPTETESYKIYSMRVGRIVQWYSYDVEIEVYREDYGRLDRVVLPKRVVPIIENPFYATMNESNSTAKRLLRVLNQVEKTNDQNSSGKLDMIIQLPYTIKSAARKLQAKMRRKDLEEQLSDSQLGIGYVDATERIIQLNRSLDNNLWSQAKELTLDLFNQLGVTEKILNGTASETEMTNYYEQTIRPFCTAIAEEIERKWLSKTARKQKQAIMFFRDPFKIIPVSTLVELTDKLTRNEIMSSNEIRSILGFKPSDDPRADQLINANLNQDKDDPRLIETTKKEEIVKDEV